MLKCTHSPPSGTSALGYSTDLNLRIWYYYSSLNQLWYPGHSPGKVEGMSTTDASASPLKKGKKKHGRGRNLETAQDSSASGNYPAQGQPPVRDVGQVPQNTERESSSEPSTNTEKQKRRRHRLSETEQTAPTGPARDRFPAMQEGGTPSTLLSTDSLVSPKADAYKPEKEKPTKRRDNRKKSKLEAEACLEVPTKKQKRRRHRE